MNIDKDIKKFDEVIDMIKGLRKELAKYKRKYDKQMVRNKELAKSNKSKHNKLQHHDRTVRANDNLRQQHKEDKQALTAIEAKLKAERYGFNKTIEELKKEQKETIKALRKDVYAEYAESQALKITSLSNKVDYRDKRIKKLQSENEELRKQLDSAPKANMNKVRAAVNHPVSGREIELGYFDSELEAAKAEKEALEVLY